MACCDSWGRKESDTTERLNSTDVYSGVSHIQGFSELYLQLYCKSKFISNYSKKVYIIYEKKDQSKYLFVEKQKNTL